jgi:DUF917 family protein
MCKMRAQTANSAGLHQFAALLGGGGGGGQFLTKWLLQ